MLVHRRVTPSSKFAGTHLYTWVERGTMRVKYLAQEHNAVPRPGLEPGPLDPESSTQTIKPPRLPRYTKGSCRTLIQPPLQITEFCAIDQVLSEFFPQPKNIPYFSVTVYSKYLNVRHEFSKAVTLDSLCLLGRENRFLKARLINRATKIRQFRQM